MAADTRANQAATAGETEDESTPQHRARVRAAKEDERRRKQGRVVVEQFLQVLPDPAHKFGGKVRLCKRLRSGNVYRLYLGRQKRVADVVRQYEKQGLKVVTVG